MNKGISGSVYNIGTNMEYTVIEVVKHIMAKMNLDPEKYLDYIEFVPDRDFQDYRYSIDTTQLEKGWSPKISFEDSISYVVESALQRHATTTQTTLKT
jgi:dTDP-D-glucose 4,6-dehydratase